MIKRISFLIIYFSFTFLFAQQSQKEYPRDYFGSPLDIPLSYAGNFCELRGNHFHAGLDIKTDGKQGQNVYATADGYISCICVSTYGYGKVVYIDHPNGYTTVYAHLQKFAPEIEKYVKENQYKAEKYEIELPEEGHSTHLYSYKTEGFKDVSAYGRPANKVVSVNQ